MLATSLFFRISGKFLNILSDQDLMLTVSFSARKLIAREEILKKSNFVYKDPIVHKSQTNSSFKSIILFKSKLISTLTTNCLFIWGYIFSWKHLSAENSLWFRIGIISFLLDQKRCSVIETFIFLYFLGILIKIGTVLFVQWIRSHS